MTNEQIRARVDFYREAFTEGRITTQELNAFIEAIAEIAQQ
jgi:hypothetical protein